MNSKLLKKGTAISGSRWIAYATAGAASAFASTPAEAAIHYSGPVDLRFSDNGNRSVAFPLDQKGDSIIFEHLKTQFNFNRAHFAGFDVVGKLSASFRGSASLDFALVSNLQRGDAVSQGQFDYGLRSKEGFGTLASYYDTGYFIDRGIGFIGFFFNGGSGKQYGWARVRMRGPERNNGFKVIDYAYADPGEKIRAGQKSSAGQMVGPNADEAGATESGSLGLLAAGAAGLALWRNRRR